MTNSSAPANDDKAAIRARLRQIRNALEAPWVREASERIQERARRLPEFGAARVVCAYLALPHEAQTDGLLRTAWERGKRVCVPALQPERGCYRLAWLRRDAALVRGPLNVMQPADPVWVEPRAIDFAAIPGVAFDPLGGRLGHGGGHYDRLLADARYGFRFKAGLAFECQIVAAVPRQTHDLCMDAVVTEQQVYRRV
jgi:5-formyltetrahydrofolate cyclo-ligase